MTNETVLFGALWHESNSFQPELTTRDHFQSRVECFGQDIITELTGTNTSVGGVIDVAQELDINLIPTVYAEAMPGGRVEKATYQFYTDRLIDAVEEHADDLDGIVLPLHGAMVPEHLDDGEGPIVSRIRDIVGDDLPITAALDLHGNITDELVEGLDAMACYQEYPHIDTGETGRRSMRLLVQTIRGEISPTMHIERPPMFLFGPNTTTRGGPMVDIMDYARSLEQEPVLEINLFYGFAKADTPSSGVSVITVTDDDQAAGKTVAQKLAHRVWDARETLIPEYPSPTEAVEQATDLLVDISDDEGPIMLCDVGDDVAAGTAGDGTPILAAMLDQELSNSGFAIIRDPQVVEEAIANGVRNTFTTTLGGKIDDLHGEPIQDLEVYVKAVTDGEFVNQGGVGTGSTVQMGRTVRLACGETNDIEVIVTESPGVPLDAEIWRHIGIQPERKDVLAIKSEIYYGEDDDHIASDVIFVDSPGLWSMDLSQFNYQKISRPIYPVDDPSDGAYTNQN